MANPAQRKAAESKRARARAIYAAINERQVTYRVRGNPQSRLHREIRPGNGFKGNHFDSAGLYEQTRPSACSRSVSLSTNCIQFDPIPTNPIQFGCVFAEGFVEVAALRVGPLQVAHYYVYHRHRLCVNFLAHFLAKKLKVARLDDDSNTLILTTTTTSTRTTTTEQQTTSLLTGCFKCFLKILFALLSHTLKHIKLNYLSILRRVTRRRKSMGSSFLFSSSESRKACKRPCELPMGELL